MTYNFHGCKTNSRSAGEQEFGGSSTYPTDVTSNLTSGIVSFANYLDSIPT